MATEDKGQEELLDYEEDEEALVDAKGDGDDGAKDGGAGTGGAKKGHYVGIHASGFRDFLLKPELLRAVVDCGFEHPSEVQHECIPQVRTVVAVWQRCLKFAGFPMCHFLFVNLHTLGNGEMGVFDVENETASFLCSDRGYREKVANVYNAQL